MFSVYIIIPVIFVIRMRETLQKLSPETPNLSKVDPLEKQCY